MIETGMSIEIAPTGDMTFMQAFGQSVLVLNSLKSARDLLEKRSATYADRPALVMAGELMGLDQVLSFYYNSRVVSQDYNSFAHPCFF